MSVIKIKEAALELFATKGYESTTIREIAEQVGLKGSSIYSHFKSKDEIFIQVVEELMRKITWEDIDIDTIKNSDEITDVKELLFKVFKSYYNFFAIHEKELLLWQRIRFFTPVKLEGSYDLNRLSYGRTVLEVYIELFMYGVEHKQIKNSNIQMLVMTFFVLISGYTDSLMLVPFILSDEQLQEGFNNFWEGVSV